ncbi:RNA-guided endonuclease InsQ/TnpB family protein [Pseudothermotoga elfii]|jgi:putative transposase
MSRYVVRTYKVPVPLELYPLCSELNKTAARIYNKTMSLVKKIKRKKGFWLSQNTVQKYILRWADNIDIHTHSKQAILQEYFQALDSYFSAVKSKPDLRPPHKKKRFPPFIWKNTAIKLIPDGKLKLSMGRKQQPIIIQTSLPAGTIIRQAKLVYENGKYYLHLGIEVKIEEENRQPKTKVMSIDLGIIHPITCFDGSETIIYRGGILNSVLRCRNKKLAEFQKLLNRCKKGSKRYRKLSKAKKRMLTGTQNQIRDMLHKITSNFVGLCIQKSVGTIVVGDITNIRDGANGNDNYNQKLHQWQYRKIVNMITDKSKLHGIKVVSISEAYTSKRCPVCGSRNHPNNRNCKCQNCGFEYHRDGVGAINIYARYPGKKSQVVVKLAPARGVRFNPHLCGHGVSVSPSLGDWECQIIN